MTDFAVFLRGVNVGGITLKMAELRSAVQTLPVTGVATLLASGNLICSTDEPPDRLKTSIEALLRTTFTYDAWVVIIEAQRLRELVIQCPFPGDDPDTHTYVTLGSDPAALEELVTAGTALDPGFTILGPEAVAWQAPRGDTLGSPLSQLTGNRRFRNSTTTRNLRTLEKVLAALKG